jgi:hypothetical protein
MAELSLLGDSLFDFDFSDIRSYSSKLMSFMIEWSLEFWVGSFDSKLVLE